MSDEIKNVENNNGDIPVAPDNNKEKKEEKQSIVAEIFDYYELCIFSLCAVIVIFSFFVRLCRVDGHSMDYTLSDGEMLLVSDAFYRPQREDIIVFHDPEMVNFTGEKGMTLVKRVIATGGEWVDMEIVDQRLKITIYDKNMENPIVLDDSEYATYKVNERALSIGMLQYPLQVPEGSVFVLGDNRRGSTDSRYFGCVIVDRILGHALMRLTPFDKIGAVD